MSFNSRTLGRVRLHASTCPPFGVLFQFTHPGKGATLDVALISVGEGVSIHAPWEGCDYLIGAVGKSSLLFQFTHPGKGATIYWGELSN